ncbi:MAG: winged helix-turn-helix domain-containing protein [Parvularculaceae bacterium]
MTEAPSAVSRAVFRAASVEVSPELNLISAEAASLRLEPKVMDLLCVLAGEPGRVFSREELIEKVWGVEFGGDESLSRAVSLLRKAFKDAGAGGDPLETVPKRGYRFVAPVTAAGEKAPPLSEKQHEAENASPRRRLFWPLAASACLAALLVIGLIAAPRYARGPAAAPANSVAVLPFDNLSASEDDAYFALGVSDELRTSLSRIADLTVAGRVSSQAYADGASGISEIGEALNVSHVLSGAVRRGGGRVRVSVELADAKTGFGIWTQSYDRELTAENLLAIQRDVAQSIAGALSIALKVDYLDDLAGARTDNLEAYDQFLRGLAVMRKTPFPNPEAAVYFQRAAELDPGYGAAWSQVALARGVEATMTGKTADIRRLRREGREMAERALSIDPNAATSHSVLASFLWEDGEWLAAAKSYERAFELGQNNLSLLGYSLFLMRSGRLEDSLAAVRRTIELDPISTSTRLWEPFLWVLQGRVEEAEALTDELTPLVFDPPMQAYARWQVALNKRAPPELLRDKFSAFDALTPPETAAFYRELAGVLNDRAAAAAMLRENYAEVFESYPMAAEDLAQIAGYLGDRELALEITERELSRSLTRMYFIWRPVMADMRRLDGFKDLVRKIGLVDYWRAYEWPDYCQPLGADDFECR